MDKNEPLTSSFLKDTALQWYFENEDQFKKEKYNTEDIVCAAFEACKEYLLTNKKD